MIGDEKVQVREGATKSLSSVVNSYFKIIKSFKTQQFWKCFKNNLLIHDNLIIEIDYGISK